MLCAAGEGLLTSSCTMQIEPAALGGTTTLCSASVGAIAGRMSACPAPSPLQSSRSNSAAGPSSVTPRLKPSPSRARICDDGTMAVGPMSTSAAPG